MPCEVVNPTIRPCVRALGSVRLTRNSGSKVSCRREVIDGSAILTHIPLVSDAASCESDPNVKGICNVQIIGDVGYGLGDFRLILPRPDLKGV